MATDIIARGMITEYIAGTNINFTENRDGTVEISASGSILSEDSVARDAIGNHKSDTSNPHNVTPAQIGLGNVDNTSDLDKPISTAVQKAIDNKADKTVATTSADGLISAEDKSKLDAFEITTTGGKLHDKDIATTDLIPTSLPANGGNADTVDGLHANEIATNPNLLINPDFKINQRGETDFSVTYHQGTPIPQSQKYTVDRWRIMDGKANISNGKFVLSGTIIQVLENSIGSDFTATVSVESGTATASYNDSTKTFSIVGNNAVLNWAKLEYGSIATPFIPPDPILELIKCHRFFYRKRNITGYFGCGYCQNPRDAYITFPLFMRIAPTVNHNGLMILSKDRTVAHDTTSTSYSITGATGHLCNFGVRIDFTVNNDSSGQMSAGCAVMLIATTPGAHGGYFELDAEIY